ncbi:MAG: flagellar biosynthesis protein FlgL, partial [Rhodobacteraceae bacterium]|nr:flagellar biosynthesis protein FlgL [Paracoccaceae bacterium]
FAALGYLGAATGTAFPVAPGRTVTLDVTAADPAVSGVLKGLVSAALLAEGALPGDAVGQGELALAAGTALISADAGLAGLRGRVGTAEARIEAGATTIAAERTALGIRRAEMLAADDFDTATALQQVEQRLELLFTVTARLSRLNLSDFL